MSKFFYQKKLNFFKKLYRLYGLGKKSINKLYLKVGLNTKTQPQSIKKIHNKHFYRLSKKGGKILKLRSKRALSFYLKIKLCKGIRFKKGYPIRGQHTRTNARTAKKLHFKII